MGKTQSLLKGVIALVALFIIALVFIQINAGKKNGEVTQFLYRDYVINIPDFEEITVNPPPNEVNDESRLLIHIFAPYKEFINNLDKDNYINNDLGEKSIVLIFRFFAEKNYDGIKDNFQDLVNRTKFLFYDKEGEFYIYKSEEDEKFGYEMIDYYQAKGNIYKVSSNNNVYYFFCSNVPLGCVYTRTYKDFRTQIHFALSDFPHLESFDQIARETTAKIVEDR